LGRNPGRCRRPEEGPRSDPSGHGHRGRRPGGQRHPLPPRGLAVVRVYRRRGRAARGRLAGASGGAPMLVDAEDVHPGDRLADVDPTAGPGGRPRSRRSAHRHRRAECGLRHRCSHIRGRSRCRLAPAPPGAGRRRDADGTAVDGRGIPAPPSPTAVVGHLLDRLERHDLRDAPGGLPRPGNRPVRRRGGVVGLLYAAPGAGAWSAPCSPVGAAGSATRVGPSPHA